MKRRIAHWALAVVVAISASAHADDETLGASAGRGPSSKAPREQANDVGTITFYTAIDAHATVPFNSGFISTRGIGFTSGNLRCSAASTDSRAVGQINLPHGVDIQVLRIWGTDNSATNNLQVELIESCLPDFGADFPTLTVKATASSSGNPGAFTSGDSSQLIGVHLADNQSCTYRVEVRLGPNDATCDDGLFFSKARVQWQRSIPPAPVSASFTDVPTNTQFFREIEAFAQTGITAGCTATEFCPDNNVTRRQMAAFFARAFGLQPGTIADPANP